MDETTQETKDQFSDLKVNSFYTLKFGSPNGPKLVIAQLVNSGGDLKWALPGRCSKIDYHEPLGVGKEVIPSM